MPFIHESGEFDFLLRIVADKEELAIGLVEKDYWVTHTLWSLQQLGLEIWFKGGTSLSKGHGLLQRFSEDLDLKIAAGADVPLPTVGNWKSAGTKATAERQAFFSALAQVIVVHGAPVEMEPSDDPQVRNLALRVNYTVRHKDPAILRQYVLLEIGEARVTPFEAKDLGSFVHDELKRQNRAKDFEDNRPKGLRCVHPLVTLLEKLDALSKRFSRTEIKPATIVRHYEDAARIVLAKDLSALTDYPSPRALAEDLFEKHQIVGIPKQDDPAFVFGKSPRWDELQVAWQDIETMFWGPRIPLEECCKVIGAWISEQIA